MMQAYMPLTQDQYGYVTIWDLAMEVYTLDTWDELITNYPEGDNSPQIKYKWGVDKPSLVCYNRFIDQPIANYLETSGSWAQSYDARKCKE
jgi:hypothetical protein